VIALVISSVFAGVVASLLLFGDKATGAVAKALEPCKTEICKNTPAVPYVQIGKK
jgi:hypothetical protein